MWRRCRAAGATLDDLFGDRSGQHAGDGADDDAEPIAKIHGGERDESTDEAATAAGTRLIANRVRPANMTGGAKSRRHESGTIGPTSIPSGTTMFQMA